MGNVRMRAEQINYGASNVKVALDDLDPMDLIALSERMDTIEAWKATVKAEEKTGAEVTFTNALALAAVTVSAEIEAEQDLHGQSAPYVGGSGKNKLILDLATIKANNTAGTWNGNVYSIAGGTVEILTDSANNVAGIKINGTFNSAIQMVIDDYTIPLTANSYIFTCGLNDDSGVGTDNNSGMFLSNINGNNSWLLSYADITYRTFTISDPTKRVRCGLYIWGGSTVNNLIYYPMIRLSSEQTTFAPYSNICPISGRTAITITDYDSESNTATVTVQLGQTVYGGTLNVTTGVMTVDNGFATFDGSDDEQWSEYTSRNGFKITISDMKSSAGGEYGYNNEFPFATSLSDFGIRYGLGDNQLGCLHIAENIDSVTDLASWKAYLASNPLQVCYELATPTTIQLTPTDLQMLKGYNRLSSDGGGDITVEAYTGAAWGGDEA